MNRLKIVRKKMKLSTYEVANKLNISQGYYSQIENNSRGLSMEIAIKLSELFNVSIDYLLNQTDYSKRINKNDFLMYSDKTGKYSLTEILSMFAYKKILLEFKKDSIYIYDIDFKKSYEFYIDNN